MSEPPVGGSVWSAQVVVSRRVVIRVTARDSKEARRLVRQIAAHRYPDSLVGIVADVEKVEG